MSTASPVVKKRPFWLRWSISELFYCLYWAAVAISFLIAFNVFIPHLTDSLSLLELKNKFRFYAIFWMGSFVFWHLILGKSSLYGKIMAFMFFPIKVPIIIMSAAFDMTKRTWQLSKRLLNLSKRVPWKTLYLSIFLTALSIGFYDTNTRLLKVAEVLLWLVVAAALWTSMWWTLNPFSFVGKFGQLVEVGKKSFIENIAKSLAKKSQEELTKTLTGLAQLTGYVSKAQSFFERPQVLLTLFLSVFFSVVAIDILAFAAIYRIRHILSGSHGFSGPFFTQDITDFLYVSCVQFTSGTLRGIEITSTDMRAPLVLQSLSALFLFTVVILAFTTVTQRIAERRVRQAQSNIENVGSEAAMVVMGLVTKIQSEQAKDKTTTPVN